MMPGQLAGGVQATRGTRMLIADIMLISILMFVLTLILDYQAAGRVNILAPSWYLPFNTTDLPYKGPYVNSLLAVRLAFNAKTIGYA